MRILDHLSNTTPFFRVLAPFDLNGVRADAVASDVDDDTAGEDAIDRDAESLRQSRESDRAGSGRKKETVPSIADAGKEYLESLSAEDRDRAFDDEELEAGRPAPAEAATEVGDDDEDPIEREDGATWNGKLQRWQLDGKIVAGDAPEGWVAPAPVAKPAAAGAPKGKDGKEGKTEKVDEPKFLKVKLAGEKDRGEEEIEVEVDEELAERIKRLQNGQIRRADYERRKGQVDAQAAELQAISEHLEQDPVGFMIGEVTPERRLEVARALVLEHLDELAPEIEKWLEDAGERNGQRVKMRDRQAESNKQLDRARQTRLFAQKCMEKAGELVPEHVDDETREAFLVDARRELHEASKAGTRVTPETVKEILARRVKLYRFDETAPRPKPAARPTSSATSATSATSSARPVTDRAREVAERRQPTRAEATAAQARIRRTQQARTASQRQAPAGAGAAPVQVPILTENEETDVRTASKALRKKGLPDSWTPAQ